MSFVPSFEGIHGILAEIQVYIFDEDGELIDKQAVRKGRAVIPLAAKTQRRARVAIGPRVDDRLSGPITLEKMRAFHAFEPACHFETDVKVHFLPEVPESIWRWWLVHSLWGTLNTLQ